MKYTFKNKKPIFKIFSQKTILKKNKKNKIKKNKNNQKKTI